ARATASERGRMELSRLRLEASSYACLAPERLDYADPGDLLLELARELPKHVLYVAASGPDPRRERSNQQVIQRKRADRDQRQAMIEEEQEARDRDKSHGIGPHVGHRGDDKTLRELNVGQKPRDQFARRVAIEER